MDLDPIDITALFLGPKSENRRYFTEMLAFVADEHVHWRRDFHPEDPAIVGQYGGRDAAHDATLERTTEALLELSARLKTSSMPFAALPRPHEYWGTLIDAMREKLAAIAASE